MGWFNKKPLWPEKDFTPTTFTDQAAGRSSTPDDPNSSIASLRLLVGTETIDPAVRATLRGVLDQLGELQSELRKFDRRDPSIEQIHRDLATMRDVELPELVSAFLEQPRRGRDSMLCVVGLRTCSSKLQDIAQELSRRTHDALEVETIYLADKYGQDSR